ncbi:MAG: hypothetical protein COX48_05960 [bacterium (Candidatus Stahlbacteria) CG23_combo_of_CG06-09_8_20_14_all_34_7]|nr:MAG: hypothetical protein COX48_05960 [bacterium (Candidatus Stahlbacteria) CG23_combo_of_CG06-09_8_20_14_all_34_7]
MMGSKIEKILRLVQEGKMSPDEADSILGLLKMKEKPSKSGCHLKVKIMKSAGDKDKNINLNLNLPINFVKMTVKATGNFSFGIIGKNDKVRESLSDAGLKFDRDGKIYDVDSFLKALDALCENSPIEIANIQVSEGDEDVDIRISID